MRQHPKLIVKLIRAYTSSGSIGIDSADLTDQQLKYTYQCGLGPIAAQLLCSNSIALPEHVEETLRSADLTARIIYRDIRETTAEILELGEKHDIPIVLLKGISAASNIYNSAHHRLMGDIDLLVKTADAGRLRDLLLDIGYVCESTDAKEKLPDWHHHLSPLYHPTRFIPVEIHTALFSGNYLVNESLFDPSIAFALTESVEFDGIPCLRFRSEFEFMYTIAHWAMDQKWTENVLSIVDAILLFRDPDRPVDWNLIESWATESTALSDYLAILMHLIVNLADVKIDSRIARLIDASVRRTGRQNMKILVWLSHTFPLQGRKKVGWALTTTNALVLWRTLLEQRPAKSRLVVAIFRILFRRNRDQSLFGYTVSRLRTLLAPNS